MKTALLFLAAFLAAVTAANVCKDYNELCPLYARFGYCKADARNMRLVCPKSCKLCTDNILPTPTPSSGSAACGRPKAPLSRIIDGVNAKKDAWPWQVSLYYNGHFLCGGSILSPNWILTAAHCVDGFDYRNYQVVLGDFNRKDIDGDEQVYRARRAFHHPEWMRPTQLNHDVALIELDRPARFNEHVMPICLPKIGEDVPVGRTCYITGWGQYTVGRGGPPSIVLKQSPLKVVSNQQCYNMNTRNLGITVTREMVCAGLGPGTKNSGCHGDSGGPFVCQENDGRWVLQGSVSWGSGYCDSREAYSVFARTSELRGWIDQYVN